MDEGVPGHDDLGEKLDGAQDVTRVMGVGIELCRIGLDFALLRHHPRPDLLPILRALL